MEVNNQLRGTLLKEEQLALGSYTYLIMLMAFRLVRLLYVDQDKGREDVFPKRTLNLETRNQKWYQKIHEILFSSLFSEVVDI